MNTISTDIDRQMSRPIVKQISLTSGLDVKLNHKPDDLVQCWSHTAYDSQQIKGMWPQKPPLVPYLPPKRGLLSASTRRNRRHRFSSFMSVAQQAARRRRAKGRRRTWALRGPSSSSSSHRVTGKSGRQQKICGLRNCLCDRAFHPY